MTVPARKGYPEGLHRFMRISTIARSNFLHDPIAWTTTLAVRHRSMLSWFVLAGLLALVGFEPTRWGAVVTLWGILGAGLVVSLILEERSEGVEHRAWLRRNRDQIKPFLDSIHSRSALLAAASVGVPQAQLQALTSAASLAAHKDAIVAASLAVESFGRGESPNPPQATFAAGKAWDAHLNSWSIQVDSQLQQNQAILPRLIEVSRALNDMRYVVKLGQAIASGSLTLASFTRFEPDSRVQVARGALQVCSACAGLLHQAGALGP